jgi:putative membrane protein
MVIDDQDRARIAAAVAAAEARISVELKLVLAPASSRYGAFALIYPGLFALLVGGLLAIVWPGTSARAMLLLETLGFSFACAVLQAAPLRRALVPRSSKRKAAWRLARLQFARLGLDAVAGRPALLFFVAAHERYVEILVDARVAARVPQESFDRVVARFTATTAAGRPGDAFTEACAAIAEALSGPFPARQGERSERSDELDVIQPG